MSSCITAPIVLISIDTIVWKGLHAVRLSAHTISGAQGPFTATQMIEWYLACYLTNPDLLMVGHVSISYPFHTHKHAYARSIEPGLDHDAGLPALLCCIGSQRSGSRLQRPPGACYGPTCRQRLLGE